MKLRRIWCWIKLKLKHQIDLISVFVSRFVARYNNTEYKTVERIKNVNAYWIKFKSDKWNPKKQILGLIVPDVPLQTLRDGEEG